MAMITFFVSVARKSLLSLISKNTQKSQYYVQDSFVKMASEDTKNIKFAVFCFHLFNFLSLNCNFLVEKL